MFAGPNGSGKSTLKSYLLPEVPGIYLMADEMDEEIRREEFLNLELYGVWTTALGYCYSLRSLCPLWLNRSKEFQLLGFLFWEQDFVHDFRNGRST